MSKIQGRHNVKIVEEDYIHDTIASKKKEDNKYLVNCRSGETKRKRKQGNTSSKDEELEADEDDNKSSKTIMP